MASAWKAERIRSASTTIFAEMSALALATRSVNLGQGFPDTDGPEFMLEEARAAIAGGMNQYPPGRGILPLRQAIAAHSSRTYGLSYDPESEVLVTTGATEALAASIWAFVDPGDEVIALEPFYDSYAASIELAGGQRVGVGLFGPEFRLDHAELAAAFTAKTKALLINSPHNPTGVVLDRSDLGAIAELAVQHDVLVICDEVYEHLTFDDAEHLPLATFPGMRERTVRISSAGKTFSATGWKIGWALATPELISEIT
jgi:N-succinyldiaminopimelate aminotransferase